MTAPRNIDPEAPPTRYEDWVGASIRKGIRPPEPIKDGVIFHLYRSSAKPGLMIATSGESPDQHVNCPNGGQWIRLKRFPETGAQRVNFSEQAAKTNILKYGFQLMYVAHSSRRRRWQDLRRHGPKHRSTTAGLATGNLTFHLFQASTERALIVVTDGQDPAAIVDCPDGGLWMPFKRMPATGAKRIGFSEAAAKKDIQRQGFHLIDLDQHVRQRRKGVERKSSVHNRLRRKTATTPRPSKRRASQ